MYKSVLDYFEETVQRVPQKMAVRHKEEECTFARLQEKAQKLGSYIIKLAGSVKNRPIVVLLPKSIEAVVSDLGISYSCNIFNNLDIKTPVHRLENIIKLLKPVMVITKDAYKDIIDWQKYGVILLNLDCIDESKMSVNQEELQKRRNQLIDTDPFCIINTSGSTGTPKGVVLNYRSFFDFVKWADETFSFDGEEIIGALSPIVFDIYDFEICLMMFKGATIVLQFL